MFLKTVWKNTINLRLHKEQMVRNKKKINYFKNVLQEKLNINVLRDEFNQNCNIIDDWNNLTFLRGEKSDTILKW